MSFVSGFPSAASPHLNLLATVHSSTLLIYALPTLTLTTRHPLDPAFASSTLAFHFCPSSPRLLLASPTTIHVYDSFDSSFHATVTHAAAPTTRLAATVFLSPTELLVSADFALKSTVWNLSTGHGIEIPHAKPRGHSIRPGTGHLAILSRTTGGKDAVSILEPRARALEATFALEAQDAAGCRWSADGRWIAVWERAALGGAVGVYTADGQLFRTWKDEGLGLGVKSCAWAGEWLVIGVGERVVGLGSRTFTPHFTLSHPSSISLPPGLIFQEQITSTGRNYADAPSPAVPPGPLPSPSTAPAPAGLTHLSASPSGALLASVAASTPTTVWIHALGTTAARTQAVLIHHHPVRSLEWLQDSDLGEEALLMHCAPPPAGSTVTAGGTAAPPSESSPAPYYAHIYAPSHASPIALPIPQPSTAGSAPPKAVALSWAAQDPAQILLASALGSTVVAVAGGATGSVLRGVGHGGADASGPGGVRIRGTGPEDAFDELGEDVEDAGDGREREDGELAVDDTFAFRAGAGGNAKMGPGSGAGAGGWGMPVR